VRIVLQRHATYKAAYYHHLPLAIINTHLDKEAATLVGAVIEIDVSSSQR
jgi:hypothetical protein